MEDERIEFIMLLTFDEKRAIIIGLLQSLQLNDCHGEERALAIMSIQNNFRITTSDVQSLIAKGDDFIYILKGMSDEKKKLLVKYLLPLLMGDANYKKGLDILTSLCRISNINNRIVNESILELKNCL